MGDGQEALPYDTVLTKVAFSYTLYSNHKMEKMLYEA